MSCGHRTWWRARWLSPFCSSVSLSPGLVRSGARRDALRAGRLAKSIHGSGVCVGRSARHSGTVRRSRSARLLARFVSRLKRLPIRALTLKIQADSLALVDSVSAKDRDEIESRMREEVLETAVYLEIVFQSTEITATKIAEAWYRLGIAGKLSLHGVTNPHRVDAQLRMMDDELRLSGDCALLQSAYRVKRVSALGGMITLKDELKLSFELVGRKQDG